MTTGIHIHVPDDRSAVGMFNQGNQFNDGDDFREDGYVYNQGQRVRPWAANVPGHSRAFVWEHRMLPTAANVQRMEARRWRVVEHMACVVPTLWRAVGETLKGRGTCYMKHPKDHEYALTYKLDPADGGIIGGVQRRPKKLRGEAIARRVHDVERYMDAWSNRVSLVESCLSSLMQHYIREHCPHPERDSGLLKLTINDRVYEYHTAWDGYGYTWERSFWPSERAIEITVEGEDTP